MTKTEQPPTTSIPPWTLGWRMKRALVWAGVSTEEMADELGVHRGTVSRWMNEEDGTPPRPAFVKLWALRCGVPYEWLATGAEEAGPGDGPDLDLRTPPGTRTQNLRVLRDVPLAEVIAGVEWGGRRRARVA